MYSDLRTQPVSWDDFWSSLTDEQQWSHCGKRATHPPHPNDVVTNEGSHPTVCVGSPATRSTIQPPRPSWDEYFLGQLPALAQRTTCDRGRSAAVFVRDNDQLAAGYVGSPPGMPHCDDIGHLWDETGKHCVRTIHAEQNALVRACRSGVSLRDSTVYCTMVPCFTCAKMLVGIGVYRVVAAHPYHASQLTRELFNVSGIILKTISDEELYTSERAR